MASYWMAVFLFLRTRWVSFDAFPIASNLMNESLCCCSSSEPLWAVARKSDPQSLSFTLLSMLLCVFIKKLLLQ